MRRTLIYGIFVSLLLGACTKPMQETQPIRKDVIETVFASGVLEANGTYSLTAQTDGYLTQVNFEQGSIVKKGALLATIDNQQNILNTESASDLYQIAQSNIRADAPALAQAQNSCEMAKRKMDSDSIQAERYQKLAASHSIAKVEYENILLQFQNSKISYTNALKNLAQVKQQAEQQLIINTAQRDINRSVSSSNAIQAIFPGKVYKKFKARGDFVKKGDVIAQIGDPNFIYAKVSVDESNIGKVQIGQSAKLQLNTQKDRTYTGRVAEIYPAFDEASQSFLCKIIFEDPLTFDVLSTQLQANIIIGMQKNALLIPRAYLDFGNRVMVKGKKDPVTVQTRFVSSEWVQIESGLEEGTTIIAEKLN